MPPHCRHNVLTVDISTPLSLGTLLTPPLNSQILVEWFAEKDINIGNYHSADVMNKANIIG